MGILPVVVCQLVSCCRQNPAALNACPPQQSEYLSMFPQDHLSQSVSYGDHSMQHQDDSQVVGLPQDGYSNGDGERWPVSGRGHEASPNASFRSHYSGYDERPLGDDMMWHNREEVRSLLFQIASHRRFIAEFCQVFW